MKEKEPKITGVGGIFFKCKDPKKLREWYGTQFRLTTSDYGILFQTKGADSPHEKQYLQWSTFSEDTTYFEPSPKEFMINYRVQNLDKLLENLKSAGVTICDEVETYDYGKFVHILDPEGNKIELWEPIDEVFTTGYEGESNH